MLLRGTNHIGVNDQIVWTNIDMLMHDVASRHLIEAPICHIRAISHDWIGNFGASVRLGMAHVGRRGAAIR